MAKVYKYKKLIVCVMLILGFVLYFTTKHFLGNHADAAEIHNTYTGLSYIHRSQVIDYDMVIKSLSKVQELVGLSGESEKSYKLVDSLFKGHGWIKDAIGQRTVTLDIHAYYKLGISLSDIKPEDIKVYGQTIFINLPKQTLISLNIPYDEIAFKTTSGLLRGGMTEPEKQTMYSEVQRLLTNNIMHNNDILEQSEQGVKDALTGLLEKIPNCNRIVFKTKI